ncbi:hypothetical protein D3C73_184970 [compost metagenome]
MSFTIIHSYSRFERWSAYDSDEIYYIEVKDDHGRIHKFQEFKPFVMEEIQERIDMIYRLERQEERRRQLINLKREGRLETEEALELLDLLI